VDVHSLAATYSSKTDDELLALAADIDSLFPDARPILESEIRRRNLLVPPKKDISPSTKLQHARVVRFFRDVGEFLLNFVIAIIGTAIMESSLSQRLGHPHSVSEVLTRAWLFGPIIAALLGLFVGRRWFPKTAAWIWLLAAALFAFRALLYKASGASVLNPFWGHFFAPDCLIDRHACTDFFVFTIPLVRTAAYSLAAWGASRFHRQLNQAQNPS
jgi:hypothetical protein